MKKWYYDAIASRKMSGGSIGDIWQIWYGEKGYFNVDILFRKSIYGGWKYIIDGHRRTDHLNTKILKFNDFPVNKREIIRAIYEA